MSFGGSVLDMIIRHRNNLSMLRKLPIYKHKRSYSEVKRKYADASDGLLNLKKASKEELAAIRGRIAREERTRKLIIGVFLVIISGVAGVFVIKSRETIKQDDANLLAKEIAITKAEATKKYDFYINDGDEWLRKNNWPVAIYQFKMAIQLYPNDYQANYRLALAYTYSCQDEKENCNEANDQIEKLMTDNAQNVELYKLRASYHYIIGDTVLALADYKTVDQLSLK